MMITHDLGVVAEIADDVIVMYAAQRRGAGLGDDLFQRPHHPYTWGLLGSLPRLDADVERLVQIPGQPPSLLNPPRGCRFHPRCPYVMDICKTQEPRARAGRRASRRICSAATSTRRRRTARRRSSWPGDGGGARWRRTAAAARSEPSGSELLVVEDAKEALPGHPRDHLPEAGRSVKAVDGVSFTRARGRDARRRRRVGLRQVDDGALHHAAARPDRRPDRLRRARHHEPLARRRCARSGAR